MATIKDLAAEAGVSISTVSIVLRGKSEERRIPFETQVKVLDAARKLDYRPNVSAQRLRLEPSANLVIAVFWASDFRAPMMVRFLRGLQEGILKCELKCEVVIHPYQNNSLHKSLLALGMCNAAIICNASESDMDYLENEAFQIPIPVVLYNRQSDKFCTVNIDNAEMGSLPARIFASRNHKHAILLTSEKGFPGMEVRVKSFMDTAKQAGMIVDMVHEDNSMQGGYEGGKAITKMDPLPDCVFCISDYMAVGALRAFSKAQLNIPNKIELISIGNGDKELEEFASTSLSVVHLPMEKMAEACLQLTMDLTARRIEAPNSIELPVVYRMRESCGDMIAGLT